MDEKLEPQVNFKLPDLFGRKSVGEYASLTVFRAPRSPDRDVLRAAEQLLHPATQEKKE
jgi:hypothetical protein